MEALYLSGCQGEGQGEMPKSDEYKRTEFIAQDGLWAAWIEYKGRRYKAYVDGEMVVYEEVK